MKSHFSKAITIVFLMTIVCLGVQGQNDTLAAAAGDKYVISAKAGGVNFVEGNVTVVRKHGKSGALLKGDELQIGDRVSTDADGKAEILLNPGSYLRLAGNTTFEFKTTSLDDLQIKLDTGNAILEVFAAEEFQVAVETPRSKYLLIATGIYRIDAPVDGNTVLRVWKGAARVDGSTETIKAGRIAGLTGPAIKFDRDERDAFDVWSKLRGKELAKMSELLKRGVVRTALMKSFLGRRWNMYSSFGLWVHDPFLGRFCFLPFGYGWSSPYGYGYGHYIGWYDLPSVIYYPTHVGGSGNPTNPTLAVTPVRKQGDRTPTPPFVRMQQSLGGGRAEAGATWDPRSGSSYPSYTPSSSSSSPAPTKMDPAPMKSDPVPARVGVPLQTKQP